MCSATENPKYEPASPYFITGILGSKLKQETLYNIHKNKTLLDAYLAAIV